MSQITIGFIGFGLMGGSIAKKRRKLHPSDVLIAYNYRTPQKHPHLEQALCDGVLSHIETTLEAFSVCDIIFLCAPVLTNISYLEKLKPYLKKDCILTDVGSVKGDMNNAISHLGLEQQFIGGHPMAGAEKTSYDASSDTLMKGAYYILTPTEKTPAWITDTLQNFVTELGAIPVTMEAAEHDEAVAAISHVPHVAAAALVNLVRSQNHAARMRQLSAGGFKDITRIASSSSEMWQNICLSNQDSIRKFLIEFRDSIDHMISMLESKDKDGIYRFFAEAKEFRDSVPDKK